MSHRMLFGLLFLAASIVPVPVLGQYQESKVLNAACANIQMPTMRQEDWLRPEFGPVVFKVNFITPRSAPYQPYYTPACDVSVQVYSAQEVNKIVDDLRDQVLKAIKAGIVQAAIKGDQVETLSDAIQRSVESELRAGALREVTELRQHLTELEKRLFELEKQQQRAMGAAQ